ncbi:MAG: hypothetical protein KDI15_13700 [Thiothrix sp.]|nr:hypothetical protein [Thiothrix sp.]HPE62421.1 hypothetical protein [Thiolinea sp.]
MTAIPVGLGARHSVQALACRSVVGRSACKPGLQFQSSRTGLIAYLGQAPVAWIVPGYHTGQQAGQPKTCRFVDVAYHRRTLRGINLETADFATVREAKTFLMRVFSQQGGAA